MAATSASAGSSTSLRADLTSRSRNGAGRTPSSATGPLRGAPCWCRCGMPSPGTRAYWKDGRREKERSLVLQRAKLAHLIAHPSRRTGTAGRTFTVPQYVVTIEGGDLSAERLLEAVERVLADPVHDLVVRLELPAGHAGRAWLERHLGPDPRVRVAPSRSALEEFPASAFHVTLPAGRSLRTDVVHRLRAELGTAVTASSVFPDGSRVSIARAWALHRASRTPWEARDFGEAVTVPPGKLKPASLLGGSTGRRLRSSWRRAAGRVAAGLTVRHGVAVHPVVSRCDCAAGVPPLSRRRVCNPSVRGTCRLSAGRGDCRAGRPVSGRVRGVGAGGADDGWAACRSGGGRHDGRGGGCDGPGGRSCRRAAAAVGSRLRSAAPCNPCRLAARCRRHDGSAGTAGPIAAGFAGRTGSCTATTGMRSGRSTISKTSRPSIPTSPRARPPWPAWPHWAPSCISPTRRRSSRRCWAPSCMA